MTTANVKMLPTAAKPLASTLENPSDIMTLGEYVVSGLQVAKTQAMARKCGHFRTFRIVLNTPARGNLRLVSSTAHLVVVSESKSVFRSQDVLSGRKTRSIMDMTTDHWPVH